MVFKDPVDFNQLYDFGIFDKLKIERRKGFEDLVIDKKLIKKICFDYFKLKILQALEVGHPVKAVIGAFMWTRRKGEQTYQLNYNKKTNQHFVKKKRDIYQRKLMWHSHGHAENFLLYYDRRTRFYLKEYLDLGLDIPLNNWDNELQFCKRIENFRSGGKYDTRTPVSERTIYFPDPDRRGRKKTIYKKHL